MRTVGLVRSDTGQPCGKDTGQKLTHYVEQGGRFEKACTACLAAGDAFLYQDRDGDEEATKTRRRKAASKTKFTGPVCEQNAWAQPDAHLICGDFEEQMEME